MASTSTAPPPDARPPVLPTKYIIDPFGSGFDAVEPEETTPPRLPPPATRGSARILALNEASKTIVEVKKQEVNMPLVAFTKSVEAATSPRAIKLSPRRPLPARGRRRRADVLYYDTLIN